jgi:hypothetical protein
MHVCRAELCCMTELSLTASDRHHARSLKAEVNKFQDNDSRQQAQRTSTQCLYSCRQRDAQPWV